MDKFFDQPIIKPFISTYKRLKTDSQNINILVKGGDIQPMGVVYGHIIWRYTLVVFNFKTGCARNKI